MDRIHALKGQVAVQYNFWERTEIEASSEKYEISIKFRLLLATQQHLESTLDPPYCWFSSIQSVCMRSLIQLFTDHTPHYYFAA